MKSHLRYKNLHPKTVGAAERLFNERPWDLEMSDQVAVGKEFLAEIAGAYRVGVPDLDIYPLNSLDYEPARYSEDSLGQMALDEDAQIRMRRFSILNLFAMARAHVNSEKGGDLDAVAWSHSLYYRVRPVMFRRLARTGRISDVTARDTYTSASWNRLVQAGVAEADGDWLSVSPEAARDILNEQEQPSDTEPALLDTQDEPGESLATNDGLDVLSRDVIRRLARENGIPRNDRNKAELITALRRHGIRA